MLKPNEVLLVRYLKEHGKTQKWIELAELFNIKPNGNREQKRKAANDIWRRWKHKDLSIKPKRLFYDIETSYNIVKSWRVGYNINLNPKDIIHERAIICVSYKWEGDDKVHTLKWNNGDDKELVEQFIKIMEEADELVGHNIDRYDTKFMLTRAIKHDILALPKYVSNDTLKIAKKHFNFNSNKLDYIAEFLGLSNKLEHRGLSMWDDIILKNDPKAMKEMIDYCEKDVVLTEEVFHRLKKYTENKTHHGVLAGLPKYTCPECGSDNVLLKKTIVTKAGIVKRLMECIDCESQFTISNKDYLKVYEQE